MRTVEQRCRLGRVFDDVQARRLRRRLEGEARLNRHLVRRREAAQKLAELEVVEDAPRAVVVVAGPARLLELELHRHVAHDGDHPLAQAHPVGVGFQRSLQPALRQLVHTFEQPLDADEVLDQLGRGLVPDPGDARDVVRGVAPQGLEVDQLRRLEAVALPDLIRTVDERVGDAASRHQGFDRFGHELQAVEVTRHDGHGVAALFRDARQGADHVVGLEAFDAVDGYRERLEDLADHVHLRAKIIGHGPATSLVLLVFLRAKCGFAEIECGDRVLGARRQHDGQHRREAVDRVGDPTIRRAHWRQSKKSSIDEAVGVDQNQPPPPSLRHVRSLRRAGSSPCGGLARSNRRDGEDRRLEWTRG